MININKTKAFTLIELLVVIAIIGLLSAVVLASLNTARAKARDAKRVSDLRAVMTALHFYYDKYGTYCVDGGSTGWGWLNSTYGSAYSVGGRLVQQGFLSSVPVDPTQGESGYMVACKEPDNIITLYATLERASVMDNCTMNPFTDYDTNTGYGKNYCISQ